MKPLTPTRIAFLAVPTLALLLAGCTRSNNSALFVSTDAGVTFVASDQLNEDQSLSGETVLALAGHPDRPNVFFAGVQEQGVVITRDAGQSWQNTGLSAGTPTDLVVHPQASQTIFVAVGQNILRSTDDAASFATLYADPGTVTALAIDPAAPQNVWLGTDQGSIVHSTNAGESWQVAQTFRRPVTDIFISPLGSAIIVGTAGDGIHISADRGQSFTVRTPEVGTRTLGQAADEIVALAQSSQVGSPILAATTVGVFSSANLGQSWQELANPIAEAGTLSGLAASPGDPALVVAVAGNTVATSRDGGQTWTTRDTPTDRSLGPIAITGSTIVVGVAGEGQGLIERTLQR